MVFLEPLRLVVDGLFDTVDLIRQFFVSASILKEAYGIIQNCKHKILHMFQFLGRCFTQRRLIVDDDLCHFANIGAVIPDPFKIAHHMEQGADHFPVRVLQFQSVDLDQIFRNLLVEEV